MILQLSSQWNLKASIDDIVPVDMHQAWRKSPVIKDGHAIQRCMSMYYRHSYVSWTRGALWCQAWSAPSKMRQDETHVVDESRHRGGEENLHRQEHLSGCNISNLGRYLWIASVLIERVAHLLIFIGWPDKISSSRKSSGDLGSDLSKIRRAAPHEGPYERVLRGCFRGLSWWEQLITRLRLLTPNLVPHSRHEDFPQTVRIFLLPLVSSFTPARLLLQLPGSKMYRSPLRILRLARTCRWQTTRIQIHAKCTATPTDCRHFPKPMINLTVQCPNFLRVVDEVSFYLEEAENCVTLDANGLVDPHIQDEDVAHNSATYMIAEVKNGVAFFLDNHRGVCEETGKS